MSPSLRVSALSCKTDPAGANIVTQKGEADTRAATSAPCTSLLLSALSRMLYPTYPYVEGREIQSTHLRIPVLVAQQEKGKMGL